MLEISGLLLYNISGFVFAGFACEEKSAGFVQPSAFIFLRKTKCSTPKAFQRGWDFSQQAHYGPMMHCLPICKMYEARKKSNGGQGANQYTNLQLGQNGPVAKKRTSESIAGCHARAHEGKPVFAKFPFWVLGDAPRARARRETVYLQNKNGLQSNVQAAQA